MYTNIFNLYATASHTPPLMVMVCTSPPLWTTWLGSSLAQPKAGT